MEPTDPVIAELRDIHRSVRIIRFFLGLLLIAVPWIAMGDLNPLAKLMAISVAYVAVYGLWVFSEFAHAASSRWRR